jgi:uncharacterized protein
MAFYIDTSAALKLVVREAESTAMHDWATSHSELLVSSDLTRTEVLGTTRRAAPDRMLAARAVLDSMTLLTIAPAIFERAGLLDPAPLRSLDAIHLACALELGDDLEGMVTYDDRLADAATAHGLTVIAPTPIAG